MQYVISDIYNDNRKFCELLEKIQFSEQDHLYILGDVFDRSDYNPNPVNLYFDIKKLGKRCTVIRGNHDDWLATYILEYFALPERKRSKVPPYSYNSFQLLKERLTQEGNMEICSGKTVLKNKRREPCSFSVEVTKASTFRSPNRLERT